MQPTRSSHNPSRGCATERVGNARVLSFEAEALMNLTERITIDPNICHGKPSIRGLRYPVELILELLSSGMTIEEILADYTDLEREDILAALAFAARLSQIKRLEPVLTWSSLLTPSSHDGWFPDCERQGMKPFILLICRMAIALRIPLSTSFRSAKNSLSSPKTPIS